MKIGVFVFKYGLCIKYFEDTLRIKTCFANADKSKLCLYHEIQIHTIN